jgi:hypothetical protein
MIKEVEEKQGHKRSRGENVKMKNKRGNGLQGNFCGFYVACTIDNRCGEGKEGEIADDGHDEWNEGMDNCHC